jgi:spermidine synthase
MTTNQNNKQIFFFVIVLFFLSGVSGLIYQLVWTRMLVLIFGNTMLAASTVLSAFMGGLAAGSYVFGRYSDKRPKGLIRVYALLEGGIGVYALLFPLLLSIAGPIYTGLYRAVGGNIVAINLVRFAICFALIAVPTFLMGATLPVLLKRFVKSTQTIGGQVGLLYGLNTIGAVAGSLICGFFLLRAVGMQISTFIAVFINLLVALLAWLLGKNEPSAPQAEPAAAESKPAAKTVAPPAAHTSTTIKLVLLGIGISGFCSLAYEVFWTRMLNLFFHNTVYSFTTILATFLMGIALGSLIYWKFLSGISRRIALFVFVEIGIGVTAYATPFIFNLLYDPLFSKSAEALTILKGIVIMIGPTILMGISLPLAVQICQRGPQKEGGSVGTVYAVNTVGSIFGAFAAGFLLLPNLGIHKSVITVVCFNLIAGLLVLISRVRQPLRWVYGAALPCILVIAFVAAPATLFRDLYQKKQPTADVIYYKEGKIANVVVYDFHKHGYKDLYLNGIEEASSRLWHVQLFKMLGALPAVVHPQPDNALMIAFGAGMSAGTTVDLVDHFECAELNPDIFEEATYFTKENRDVINNPKLNMVFNDGRNHLLLTPKKYSLIISDATNPLAFDSWTLYTKEFYELCKKKLKPGGIFCQWVPIPLPSDSIKVILNTFRSVFPHTSFWVIYGSSQCLMLATPERLNLDYQELKAKLPGVLKTTDSPEYAIDTVEKFLSFFMMGEDGLGRYLAGFDKINTDDLPDAQFHSGLNQEGIQASLEMVKYQETIEPYLTGTGEEKNSLRKTLTDYSAIARLLHIGFLRNQDHEYKRALAYTSATALAGDENIVCMLKYGPKLKEYFVKRVKDYPKDANARNTLGYILWHEGNYQDAIAEFKQAIALKPDFANAHANLGRAYVDASLFDEAVEQLLATTELNPTADVLNMQQRELGIIHKKQKLRYHKKDIDAYIYLADSYLEAGEIYKAIDTLKEAYAALPNERNSLISLAYLYENAEQWDKAAELYQLLAEKFPDDKNAHVRLNYLTALRNDPATWNEWISQRVAPRQIPPEEHPEGCGRALKKWTKFHFEGKVSRKNLEEAALELEKVIKADPKHMHAYADAATIYEYLKEYWKAAQLWREGLVTSPGNQMAANNARRLELMEQLHFKNPGPEQRIQLYNDIGVLYWQNGQLELAIRYFKQALEENPDHPMSWANLGANYIEVGKYREALQAIKHALELKPGLQFAGQMKERMQWLEKTIKNN